MGVSAYRRLGKKTAFRHGYDDKEVSPELMMLCKASSAPARPPCHHSRAERQSSSLDADTPIRPYVPPLEPPRLDLRLITVHNHVKNFLTCDEAVCRIVDISIGADHRDAKVANSVSVSDCAWIRQYNERNVRTRNRTGFPGERNEEQRISGRQLFRTAIQLLDLLNKCLLTRILGEDQHYRMAADVTKPAHFAIHAAPKKFRSRTRNRGHERNSFRFGRLSVSSD